MQSRTVNAMYVLIACTLGIGLGIADCSHDMYPGQRETLRGYPVSVETVCGNVGTASHISTVVKDKNGNYILCRGFKDGGEVADAAALINSEIEDNDNEMVELVGKYNGELFNIESVSANGYTVELSK